MEVDICDRVPLVVDENKMSHEKIRPSWHGQRLVTFETSSQLIHSIHYFFLLLASQQLGYSCSSTLITSVQAKIDPSTSEKQITVGSDHLSFIGTLQPFEEPPANWHHLATAPLRQPGFLQRPPEAGKGAARKSVTPAERREAEIVKPAAWKGV